MDKENLKSAIESMLFAFGEPLDATTMAKVLEVKTDQVKEGLTELIQLYEERNSGLRIKKISNKYAFHTALENYDYIEKLCNPAKRKKLSQAALEVLAITAYHQPVTRATIDSIRGIKGGALDTLVMKGLIEEKGKSEGVGRPTLYGTTEKFLQLFGLSSLKDLPPISDIEALVRENDLNETSDLKQITMNIENPGGQV